MVVDKYVSRCLDVGSTPTGSIILKNVDDLNVFSVLIQVYNITSRYLNDGNIKFSSIENNIYIEQLFN